MRAICTAAACAVCCACAPSAVDLGQILRIETPRRFATTDGGDAIVDEPWVLDGDRLRAVVATARCHAGTALWKGGIPATLVLADGTRRAIDGFSDYGAFLRFGPNQWCEIDEALWSTLWSSEVTVEDRVDLRRKSVAFVAGYLVPSDILRARFGPDFRAELAGKRLRLRGTIEVHVCAPEEECLASGRIPRFRAVHALEVVPDPDRDGPAPNGFDGGSGAR
jgi:hypothetical protein